MRVTISLPFEGGLWVGVGFDNVVRCFVFCGFSKSYIDTIPEV